MRPGSEVLRGFLILRLSCSSTFELQAFRFASSAPPAARQVSRNAQTTNSHFSLDFNFLDKMEDDQMKGALQGG